MRSALHNLLPSKPLDSYSLFAALLGISILFHGMSYGFPLDTWTALLYGSAGLVLLRPSFLPAFALMLFMWVAKLGIDLPRASNHSFFLGFICLTILAAIVVQIIRQRTLKIDSAALYQQFAPLVRIELIVLYSFTVLHKLNSGFFDPRFSCAVEQYTELAGQYTFLPVADWAKALAIYGSMMIEIALPILLLVRRWRIAGVLLGFGFHFVLAMNPVEVIYNFSALILAVYFLFLPDDFANQVNDWFAPARAALTRFTARPIPGLLTVGAGLLLFLTIYLIIFRRSTPTIFDGESGRILWVLYSAVILGVFLRIVTTRPLPAVGVRQLVGVRARVLLVFPVLMIFNGLSPYLGLKTESSFAMFSNLYTEDHFSNHFFMPTWLQLWDYQHDVVTVLETSRDGVRRTAKDWRWTYFEFHDLMSRNLGASVTYERGGVVYTLARVDDDPALAQPIDPLLRKLLRFRNIPKDFSRPVCQH